MNITRIGIDISKRVRVSHAIAVSQAREHTVWAYGLKRGVSVVIGLEALVMEISGKCF